MGFIARGFPIQLIQALRVNSQALPNGAATNCAALFKPTWWLFITRWKSRRCSGVRTGHRLLETKRTMPGFPNGMAGRESREMNSSM